MLYLFFFYIFIYQLAAQLSNVSTKMQLGVAMPLIRDGGKNEKLKIKKNKKLRTKS